jgi:hypothetical protein
MTELYGFCSFCYGCRDDDGKGNCTECGVPLRYMEKPPVRSFAIGKGELGLKDD